MTTKNELFEKIEAQKVNSINNNFVAYKKGFSNFILQIMGFL